MEVPIVLYDIVMCCYVHMKAEIPKGVSQYKDTEIPTSHMEIPKTRHVYIYIYIYVCVCVLSLSWE